MSHEQQIRERILSLNEAWRAGRFDEIAGFYHPAVVLLPPDAGEPIIGRTAVIASYREFAETARLHAFEVTSLEVFAFEDASVCHMRFEIEYETERGRFLETGLEVYVLTGSPANSAIGTTSGPTQPVIVWRSQSVLDTAEVLPKGGTY